MGKRKYPEGWRAHHRDEEEVESPAGGEIIIISGKDYVLSAELLAVKARYDDLTERQRKWLDQYLVNRNATLSAQHAGYGGGDGTLRRMGKANKDKLQGMIDVLDNYAKELTLAITELTGIYNFWGVTLADSTQSMRDRLKASELLARALGAFDGENGDINININTDKLDTVSEEILEAFIVANTTDTYAVK